MEENKEKNEEQLVSSADPLPETASGEEAHAVADEEIHDSSYGLSKRGRSVIVHIVTALICAAIIAGSYAFAVIFPVNDAATEEYAETLRKSEAYTSIKDEFSKLTAEVQKLNKTVAEKKEQSDDLSDPENTKAELRAEIDKKAAQLKEINTAVNEKNDKIAELDTEIASVSGITVSLSPGRYTVGRDIAPGKYSIMGFGSFAAASADGESKYNTTLGSTPFEIELSSGDRLKLDCTVKFIPSA